MSELVAVFGDKNSHNDGDLLADNNSNKLFIEGKKVVMVGSSALPDDADHPNPKAATGTSNFYVSGIQVHRNNDSRDCGAKTVVTNQSKVFSG